MSVQTHSRLTPDHLAHYTSHGWTVLRGFRDPAAVAERRDHYTALREAGTEYPGDMGGRQGDPADPLNAYPRMINMQAWDQRTAQWARAEDLLAVAEALLGAEPVLRQTMLYFKPPGARGQGLHQDEQYITQVPLLGAWLALDDCDEANGCMTVVDGSHRLGHLPVEPADPALSFTAGQTMLPAGAEPHPVIMTAGDLLLFDGKTIHGSMPNVTTDRFRRSLIYHFLSVESEAFTPEAGTTMRDVGRARA